VGWRACISALSQGRLPAGFRCAADRLERAGLISSLLIANRRAQKKPQRLRVFLCLACGCLKALLPEAVTQSSRLPMAVMLETAIHVTYLRLKHPRPDPSTGKAPALPTSSMVTLPAAMASAFHCAKSILRKALMPDARQVRGNRAWRKSHFTRVAFPGRAVPGSGTAGFQAGLGHTHDL